VTRNAEVWIAARDAGESVLGAGSVIAGEVRVSTEGPAPVLQAGQVQATVAVCVTPNACAEKVLRNSENAPESRGGRTYIAVRSKNQ